jgi:signal transduction histidine kinase
LRRARAIEAGLLIVAGAFAGSAVFAGWIPPSQAGPFVYVVFPPIIWAAASFRQRGATAGIFFVSAFAIAGTALGQGPFVRTTLLRGLFELQSFLAIVTVMLLALAAAVSERDRARRDALAAVRGRDEFLAIASHELRTPLGALGLQLTSIARSVRGMNDSAEASLRAKVALAERQSDRLSALVKNLLDVSKLDAETLELNRERVDIAALVRDVASRLAEEAARASSKLVLDVEAPMLAVCDPLRIEQILVNLLSNAFRHGAGKDVSVKLSRIGDCLQLAVTDHGDGIEKDRLESIFARFDRGAQRTEGGGLGLGLYISRRLAEAHGGRLFAESGTNGATFTLELPANDDPALGLEKP